MTIDKPLTPEEFQSIYSKVPRLCVEVIVQTSEGILLTLRSLETYHGQWHMPGGTLAYQESIEGAVERIARSELGISVVMDSYLGYIEYLNEEQDRGFGCAVGLAFLCHPADPTASITLNHEASEYKMFKELPSPIIKEQGEFLRTKGLLK